MGDRMGMIIHLNPPPKATPLAATGEPVPQCEIVIFPGVRIEREKPGFAAEARDPQSDSDTGNGRRPRKSS